MSIKFNSKVLVAPLDWGLGHSTRCIPIIHHLLQIGCNVIVAAEGAQEKLLKLEFPFLQFVHLKGYRIQYANSKRFFAFKILMQLPKIYVAIKYERKWLHKLLEQEQIDAVISDNRYGLYHSKTTNVFITHQLTIKAPFKLAETIIQKINYRLIGKFSVCWVPDEPGIINLAGLLSHPRNPPVFPVKYLGCLSRFNEQSNAFRKYKLLILISGPEPQRTAFENKLLADLKTYTGNGLLVRGLPGAEETLESFNHVTIKNHLTAFEMEEAFQSSEIVISRTGYTTVMDICKLQKKAILIPTPGQTEQEYLADHLNKQQWCLTMSQQEFQLNKSLASAEAFPFNIPVFNMDRYKQLLDEFIGSLQKIKSA